MSPEGQQIQISCSNLPLLQTPFSFYVNTYNDCNIPQNTSFLSQSYTVNSPFLNNWAGEQIMRAREGHECASQQGTFAHLLTPDTKLFLTFQLQAPAGSSMSGLY